MCSGPSGTKEKMKRLLIAFLYFSALTTLMVGCTTITGQNATQKLKNRNCEIAANAAELYQVSIDHWVDFEMEQGLGRLMRSSFFWKRKSGKISDPARRQRAEGALSALIENTAVQYVNALTMSFAPEWKNETDCSTSGKRERCMGDFTSPGQARC
jgi:hypothetical protein